MVPVLGLALGEVVEAPGVVQRVRVLALGPRAARDMSVALRAEAAAAWHPK